MCISQTFGFQASFENVYKTTMTDSRPTTAVDGNPLGLLSGCPLWPGNSHQNSSQLPSTCLALLMFQLPLHDTRGYTTGKTKPVRTQEWKRSNGHVTAAAQCSFKVERVGSDLRQRLFWDTEVLNLALYSLRMFLKRGHSSFEKGSL